MTQKFQAIQRFKVSQKFQVTPKPQVFCKQIRMMMRRFGQLEGVKLGMVLLSLIARVKVERSQVEGAEMMKTICNRSKALVESRDMIRLNIRFGYPPQTMTVNPPITLDQLES